MTKAKINKYAQAIVDLSKEKTYSKNNVKKIQKLILLANDKRVCDALTENNVDVARFNARALYATEKCVKIVHAVTRDTLSIADLNENAFAAIKCAILAYDAQENMLKSDIESAILSDCKIDEKRKHLIFKRKAKISAVAQVQQSIDMLKTLNIVKEIARNVFEIQESALFDTFKQKFENVSI